MDMKTKNAVICIILVIIMTFSYNYNILDISNNSQKEFNNYQKDSEDLVIGGIIRDKYNLNNDAYGLQIIDGVEITDYKKYNELLENGENINVKMPYKSQVGLQGRVFSFLYNKLNIPIKALNLACSILLSIVLVTICCLLKEKYGKLFAGIFYIVFLLSPMLIMYARNLYWVPFTWFLPLMLCLLLQKTNNMKLYLPLIFLSVFIKSLCGYEYLSTILVCSVSFLITDIIMKKETRRENIKRLFIIGIISILAFATAICIHAVIRGDGNIEEGIKSIIQQDVMRRTMGNNAEMFDQPLIQESIRASYISTIKKYYYPTNEVILGVSPRMFRMICIFSFVILIYNLLNRSKNSFRDFCLYMLLYISTLSWFILGKGHAYTHVPLNLVLWYFGYIQMAIYVIVKFVITELTCYIKRSIEGKNNE